MEKRLQDRLKNPTFLSQLNQNGEVGGHYSPGSGKITYNRVVHRRSFAVFTDMISSIVPIDVVLDTDRNGELPSLANVLRGRYAHVFRKYLFVNATMGEYMDYEDEEDQEAMDELLEEVDALPQGTGLIGIAVQKSAAMQSVHASAFVVWRRDLGADY